MSPKTLWFLVLSFTFLAPSKDKTPLILPLSILSENFANIKEQKERKIAITLESVLQMWNNHLGGDWEHFLSVQEQIIKKGETLVLPLKKRAPLSIEAHSIETDKHFSDTGKKSMEFIYSDLIAIEQNRFEVDVVVIENGGQFAGNTAKWKFIFKLQQLN